MDCHQCFGLWSTCYSYRLAISLCMHISTLHLILVCYIFIIYCLIAAESVFARCLSAIKDDRVAASKVLQGPQNTKFSGDKEKFIEDIRQVCALKCNCEFCIRKVIGKYIADLFFQPCFWF